MATPSELAIDYATNAAGQLDLDAIARELLDTVGEIERSQYWDTGAAGAILVVLPGWRNHGNPGEFIVLSWPG